MRATIDGSLRVCCVRAIDQRHHAARNTISNGLFAKSAKRRPISQFSIKEILSESEFGLKGEFVIVIDGTAKIKKSNISEDDSRILDILMDKLDNKLALEIGSEILNKKRNQLYKIKLKD